MGIYLNPGVRRFQMAVDSEIYVDKTEMIRHVNAAVQTDRRYLSVSRPRRFGKTMAADMLCAYYGRGDGGRELFEHTLLSSSQRVDALAWDVYLGAFDVVRVTMTDFIKRSSPVAEGLALLARRLLQDLEEAYPGVDGDPADLAYSFERYYRASGVPFVVVIDEWDSAFRERKDDAEGQQLYLDFLRDWLKDREYVALAYMTGILPIKKYGRHSALNMFDEYSMATPMQFARYAGFTDAEVRELCSRYHMGYEEISAWYDGYRMREHVPEKCPDSGQRGAYRELEWAIYSPLSVVRAVSTGFVQNWWNKTETYEALAEYICMDFDGLRETVAFLMDGGRTRVELSGYQNDMTTFHNRDDVLALLIHLGYLGWDAATGEAFVPNREILDEFRMSTRSDAWRSAFDELEASKRLLDATWAGEESKVAEMLESAHDRAENKTYHSEAALSYAIQLAYYAAQRYYTIIPELDTGKGYADVVFLPSPKYPEKPAMLVELKYAQDVESPIEQIRKRNYPARLEHYAGNLLLVGVNYNRDARPGDVDYKRHTCRIERV